MKGTRRSKPGRISAVRFLSDQAYEIIREAIVFTNLRPEERLKVSELAKELRISASPIRETLTRLKQEGFVETIRFKGVYVAQHDVEEIFALGELMEGAAVKRAATICSTVDLQKAEALLEKVGERIRPATWAPVPKPP